MDLKTFLLGLLLQSVPPGQTVYSLERVPECGDDPQAPTCEIEPVCSEPSIVCKAPRWATSKGAWVRYESPEAAERRYDEAMTALVLAGSKLLCLDGVEGCEPLRWGWDRQKKANRGTLHSLTALALAAGIAESGFREDVQTGRGRSSKTHRLMVDGGEGRGPGNEAGYWQAHPVIAWRFMGLEKRPDRVGHYLTPLLGEGIEPVERAAEVAIKMLAHSREWCGRTKVKGSRRYPWAWAAISYYGTGHSCDSVNDGKTTYRYNLFVRFMEGKPALPKPVKPQKPRTTWKHAKKQPSRWTGVPLKIVKK